MLSALSGALLANPALSSAYDAIISALAFVSLGTTILVTSLIGFKIYSITHMTGRTYTHYFQHVVAIFLESAAAYSLVLLVYAITMADPAFSDMGSGKFLVGYYLQNILNFVAVCATICVLFIKQRTLF